VRKGESTRERILQATAPLFNRRGFAGASMADVMGTVGLEKGGIYRHFPSKDALALASFDYAIDLVAVRIREALDGAATAPDQLLALVDLWRTLALDPPVAGGCPLLNTAIEADDTHPALRERARAAMSRLLARVRRIVEEGKSRGELRAEVDAEAVASLFVGTLEGALFLTRLHDDDAHMHRAATHLRALVREYAAPVVRASAQSSTRDPG
jgi:TetR/AcrR family transcriptional regulator, transcriptional repressor for nem operon